MTISSLAGASAGAAAAFVTGQGHADLWVGATLTAGAALLAAGGLVMLAISMGVQSDDLRRRALGLLALALGPMAYWLSLAVARMLGEQH